MEDEQFTLEYVSGDLDSGVVYRKAPISEAEQKLSGEESGDTEDL